LTEPSELAGRRAERSQRLRDQSPDVLVALPSSDGELVRALGDLEEVLRLVDLVDADPQALPPPLNEGRAAEAVGKLASYVASAHRAIENGHPGVQPVGPDGRYELVPLSFARLRRADHASILGAVRQLTATRTSASHPALDEALSDYTADPEAAEALVARAERVAALLELAWDDDVDVLSARLGHDVAGQDTERIVLAPEEYEAYLRVTGRILASWHAGDPLEGFIYRGTT
jgi:hypothetical protein